jgi:prenyltransferase beta subunit
MIPLWGLARGNFRVVDQSEAILTRADRRWRVGYIVMSYLLGMCGRSGGNSDTPEAHNDLY